MYKSQIDGTIYSENDLEQMALTSDSLTSDNLEKEIQNIIDELELESIG